MKVGYPLKRAYNGEEPAEELLPKRTVVFKERHIKQVKNVRKINDAYEYLVKWSNNDDDEEWLHRDIIIKKYPQEIIYFLENISSFK